MKKTLSFILSILMVLSVLPAFAVSSFAETFTGPNDSEHAFLTIHSEGEDYTLFFRGKVNKDVSVKCMEYDLSENTLTLENYNEPGTIIEASEMGSDFKINVVGSNHIKAVTAFADKYMNSILFVGDGSISINEEKSFDDIPIYLNANMTGSIIEIDNAVKLSVYSDDVSVKVLNSLNEEPIVASNTEYKISSYESSLSQPQMIIACSTQMNEFSRIYDSELYATAIYDKNIEDTVYCEFELINKNIDGEEIIFAKQIVDDFGNYIPVAAENINPADRVNACQLLYNEEKQLCLKENDETDYAVSEYSYGESEELFWSVYKVIYDEQLGNFFYPVATLLTEEPTEYVIQKTTVYNNYKYIESDFANFEEEAQSDYYFTAKINGSNCAYHGGDTVYIEKDDTALITFDITDKEGNAYVGGWYSLDMADAGFEIAPDPVMDGETAYASIKNCAVTGKSGTLIINAFSIDKFLSEGFDWVNTQPDATFTLNIVSADKFVGTATVNGTDKYVEGDTITVEAGKDYTLYYSVENYPDFAIHGFNADILTDAGFECEQLFDELEWPYCVFNTGTAKPGTTLTVPFHIYRFEDLDATDWDFETTPMRYIYNITFKVGGACEHKNTVIDKAVAATCTKAGKTEGRHCADCGEILVKQDTVPAKKHTAVKTAAKAATCTESGNKTYYTCKTCKKVFSDSACTKETTVKAMTIAATGHKKVSNTMVRASIGKNGKTAGMHCSACGKILVSQKPVYMIKTVKLSATKYTYDGKVKSPVLTVKDSKGKDLVKGTDYTVTVPTGRKAVGKYTYKVTFKGKYTGTKTLSFTIVPKTTSISSLNALSKGFTAKWKKQATQTTGYQIQIATNSKFTKGVKTYKVTKNTTVSKKITKLTGAKKYYVRIRTYKTVSKTDYYSDWSAAKYVTTKK